LLKEVSTATPNVGDVITFTITVSNDGPSDATGVDVIDNLPNGYANITNVGNGGSAAGSIVTWVGLNLPVGGSEVLTFDAEVLAPGAGVDYLNIAEVTAMDQTDSDSIEVQLADVSLVKEVSTTSPNVGDAVTFTITVSNDGPSDATNVAVSDLLPNGYSNIANISNGGIVTGSNIDWTGLNIATGTDVVLTFDADVLAPGTGVEYLNIAEVTAMDQLDSDSEPGNDDGHSEQRRS